MHAALAPRHAEAGAVLDFWLGPGPHDGRWAAASQARWFRSDPALDAELARRFGALPAQAAQGAMDDWLAHPADWLAYLIVVDQFPRNLHRDHAEAFALDPLGQRAALDGQARGLNLALPAATRLFCYLPFEHAEDGDLQARSLSAFEALHAQADSELRGPAQGWLDYARRHAEPIRRFGRFPHRNAVLGRTSSADELDFLAAHPAGF